MVWPELKMQQRVSGIFLSALTVLFLMVSPISAPPVDITNESFVHFGSFINDPTAPATFAHISDSNAATAYGDFGWHNSPSDLPGSHEYAGIILPNLYTVTGLRFQVHSNPFKDFTLQGSINTTTGLDGDWSDIFSETVTERREWYWQEWSFTTNTLSYSAYRIDMKNAYAGGWAMYRWDLLGEPANTVPEPATLLLLGAGLAGVGMMRRKLRR